MWKVIPLTFLFLMLVACQPTSPVAVADNAPTAMPSTSEAAASPTEADFIIQSTTPITTEAAGLPIRLVAPTLDLAIPVTSMGWQIAQVEGERQARWEVPEASAGWHLNSAHPGTAGNMVFSGHHRLGTAVFAPLARGELAIGDPLLVTDDQGRTFLYQVSEIGDPIPAIGGTREEQQRAEAYLAPTTEAKVTLVTGWPEFSDTHYLFIQANFAGLVQ